MAEQVKEGRTYQHLVECTNCGVANVLTIPCGQRVGTYLLDGAICTYCECELGYLLECEC